MAVKQRRPAGEPEYLISRPAQARLCARCRAAILVGMDRGMPIRADAVPVDQAGEVDAIVAGRLRFQVLGSSVPFLVLRDLDRIRAGWPRGGVYVAHACGGGPA